MPLSDLQGALSLPVLGPGTRVHVEVGEQTLFCRAARMQGNTLHLTVSEAGRSQTPPFEPGTTVQLTMFRAGTCWEFQATVSQWVVGQPPMLVVGALRGWVEKQRRQEDRAPQSLDALFLLDGGGRALGRTLDLSTGGVSLLLPASITVAVGMEGRLTLRLSEESWCSDIPMRVTRLENWLHARGRSLRVGAALAEGLTPEERTRWEACLRCLETTNQ